MNAPHDQLAYPFLPRLDGADLSTPTRLGLWQDNGRAVLTHVAEGIVYSDDAPERGVSAVPDPWARALMFQSALRPGSRHPLRDIIVKEWRGMLSLLALRSYRNYDVQLVPVNLGRDRLSEALHSLKPAPVELEPGIAYDWTDVLLVVYDGIPLGALSPTTLVYTGADYSDLLRDTPLNLQQRDRTGEKNGLLGPPTEDEDIEFVAEWVQSLQRRLSSRFNPNPDSSAASVTNALNELLSTWLDDLRRQLGRERTDSLDAEPVKMATQPGPSMPDWAQLERYKCYFDVLCPLVADEEESTGPYSDLSLRSDPDRNYGGYDEVVVITPRLLRNNPRVWRTRRAKHFGDDPNEIIARFFDGASGTAIDGEDLIVRDQDGSEWRALWIRPELFFLTDTLLRSDDDESLLHEGERSLNEARDGRRFLLPFRREILDYFGPERIQALLRPVFEPAENGVKFSFRLPVGENFEEVVERVYKYKDPGAGQGAIVSGQLPLADIFPRYLGPGWRRYYVVQDLDAPGELAPVAYGAHEPVSREHRLSHSSLSARITALSGDDPFPDGFVVRYPEEGASPSHSAVPVGLILTGRDDARDGLTNSTWHVGIDFGTSNTNVYKRDGEAEHAHVWKFDFPSELRPLTNGDSGRRDRLLSTFLVPDASVELPIPTLLNLYSKSRKEELMLDYSVYFGGQYSLPEYVEANLKWDVGQRKTDIFLEGLMFLLLVDIVRQGVAEVQLYCSFPKAYSELQLNTVKHEWSRVFGTLFQGQDRVMTLKEQSSESLLNMPPPRFQLEGRAAGEFFASPFTIKRDRDRADKAAGAVCLDVGGGTTDISVWYNNEIVLDASVLMAGDLVARFLMKSTRLREYLFSPRALEALDEVAGYPNLFGARLNIILKEEEKAIREDQLSVHINKQEMMELRQLLILEFGAIVYYSAWLLAAADKTDEVREELLRSIAQGGVRFHWGGNAAKLISWLDIGAFRPDGLAAKVLNAVLFQGLKDVSVRPAGLGQIQSPGHKSEVAGGLVVPGASRASAEIESAQVTSNWSDAGTQSASFGAGADEPASGASGGEMGMMAVDEFEDAGLLSEEESDSVIGVSTGGVVSGERFRLTDGRIIEPHEIVDSGMLFAQNRTTFDSSSLERIIRFVDIANTFSAKYGLVPVNMRVNLDQQTRSFLDRRARQEFKDMERDDPDARAVEPVFITEVKSLLNMLISDRSD